MARKKPWPYCRVASRRRAKKVASKAKAPRPPPLIPYEREVQKSIILCFQIHKCKVWRRNVGTVKRGKRYIRFGEPGQADLYGYLPDGRHFECEVKRPGKYPTKDQMDFLLSVNGHNGALAFWADSAELVDRVLGAIIHQKASIKYLGKRVGARKDHGDYALVFPD